MTSTSGGAGIDPPKTPRVLKAPGIALLSKFRKGRGHEEPKAVLEGFRGSLQSGGYSVYRTILGKLAGITPFCCWAHVRRKFHESLEANGVGAAWDIAEIQVVQVEEEARVPALDAQGSATLRRDSGA